MTLVVLGGVRAKDVDLMDTIRIECSVVVLNK